MVQFNVHEAKSNLSKLLDLALEGEEVVISRHGVPVAKLTPVQQKKPDRPMGFGRGTVHFLTEDWNAPMTDEEADAFWEGRW
jgi:prevent-host-death family protein